MTQPQPRRTRAWKILGIVVGGILLSLGGLYLWIVGVASRQFERVDAEITGKIAERRARDGRRPVLRGEAQPGNAADDYQAAFAAIKAIKDYTKVADLVERSPKADLEKGKAALAAAGPALDQLRRGAARDAYRYPYEWEQGAGMKTPDFLGSQSLVNFIVMTGRTLAEEGKPREAAGVLLDGLQLGRDIGDDGVLISGLIGSALLNLGLREIGELLSAGKFDETALRDLDAGLATLEGGFPGYGKVLGTESLTMAVSFREQVQSGSAVSQLFLLNAHDGTSRCMARAVATDTLPWAEAQKEMASIEQEAKASWNPLVKITVPGLLSSQRVFRERRAHLRLVRIAVHYRLTGKILELNDPFGTTMATSTKDGAFKVWSVGANGVDDGGDGRWKTDGKDLVLELKK